MDELRRLADAVLYEGHVLWPYRRSAIKNRQRWTFGGVYPRVYAAASADRSSVGFQCLVEGRDPRAELELRFLHAVHRQCVAGADFTPVDEVGGYLTWDEARERSVTMPDVRLATRTYRLFAIPGGQWVEPVEGGALLRTWRDLTGVLEATMEPVGAGVHRLDVSLSNTAAWRGTNRDDAVRRTLLSAHVIARVRGGRFLSAIDNASEVVQTGLWPVLVGDEGEAHTMLAAPIILSDHPRVAPESPGDFFDGGEIDQLLVLNILALSDAEKREIAAGDPRAREVLERTEAMTPDALAMLNGTIRDMRPVSPP
jgi:hypothetical protein